MSASYRVPTEIPPELSWTTILLMFEAYMTGWETGERGRGPWPDDPDGGELRLIGALRDLVHAAVLADDQGTRRLDTGYIRRHLSRCLTGTGTAR